MKSQIEFTCPDCGYVVTRYDGDVGTRRLLARRCWECDFIAGIEDPAAREQIRRLLKPDDSAG
jgi:hypothetical protein